MSAALLIKLLARKSLLDWQGLVLAAPRAPEQRLPPQRQKPAPAGAKKAPEPRSEKGS